MKVEVKETQSNQVDWSKNPQLVISSSGIIVKVIEKQTPFDNGCFSGVCLNDDDYSVQSGNGWNKSDFKPFHGSITLSND